MSSIVARQSRMELETYAPLFPSSKKEHEVQLLGAKKYRCKSYSIIGWTGPKVKGLLVRAKYR